MFDGAASQRAPVPLFTGAFGRPPPGAATQTGSSQYGGGGRLSQRVDSSLRSGSLRERSATSLMAASQGAPRMAGTQPMPLQRTLSGGSVLPQPSRTSAAAGRIMAAAAAGGSASMPRSAHTSLGKSKSQSQLPASRPPALEAPAVVTEVKLTDLVSRAIDVAVQRAVDGALASHSDALEATTRDCRQRVDHLLASIDAAKTLAESKHNAAVEAALEPLAAEVDSLRAAVASGFASAERPSAPAAPQAPSAVDVEVPRSPCIAKAVSRKRGAGKSQATTKAPSRAGAGKKQPAKNGRTSSSGLVAAALAELEQSQAVDAGLDLESPAGAASLFEAVPAVPGPGAGTASPARAPAAVECLPPRPPRARAPVAEPLDLMSDDDFFFDLGT